MSRTSFPTQRLEAAYMETVTAALPAITEQFASMVADIFRQRTRHIIDYEQRTPTNNSGKLIDTTMPFIVERYATVADFWEESAGYRETSFAPGYIWNFPTVGSQLARDFPAVILKPLYLQALHYIQQEEPAYYQQLAANVLAEEYTAQKTTIAEVSQAIFAEEIVGDIESSCENLVLEHIRDMPLATLLHQQQLPRRCQRSALAQIENLPTFVDELASYCSRQAKVTALTEGDVVQMILERTPDGVVFGNYDGGREYLMDHIAHNGSVIMRSIIAETDRRGTPIKELRGWMIRVAGNAIIPQRILPDDLYHAMNTDAQTGAKLPPEPDVRYL